MTSLYIVATKIEVSYRVRRLGLSMKRRLRRRFVEIGILLLRPPRLGISVERSLRRRLTVVVVDCDGRHIRCLDAPWMSLTECVPGSIIYNKLISKNLHSSFQSKKTGAPARSVAVKPHLE